MIDQANGVLPILAFDAQHSWEHLLQLCHLHLDGPGLERIKAAVGAATKTVFVERHYIDKDYRDTFSNYHSKKFHTPDSRCVRLHFFAKTVDRNALTEADGLNDKDYLGYSVIRPTRPNCIGRTMLCPESRPAVVGMMSLCESKVNIQGKELRVKGYPFISQDTDVTVCAQATLWMLLRYFSNRYAFYREVYPIQIGNLTRDYSVGRLFPTQGLYVWQMTEALRQSAFAPVIYSRSEFGSSFGHLLYTYIESGIPVLAAFKNHVVVLFGHQSDYTTVQAVTPQEDSPFIFSSTFNRAFVGNDDNGIPYQLLRYSPTQTPWEEMCGPSGFLSINDIQQFVVPLPERVFLPAEDAEKLMTAILLSDELGYARLSARIACVTPVLRLFLTTGKSFKNRVRQRDGMGNPTVEAMYRELPLPHFIWVCEISDPELYPAHVLGELIWDATRNPYEPNGFLAVHYPEILVVDWGSALNDEPKPIQFPLDKWAKYPIFAHNLTEIR